MNTNFILFLYVLTVLKGNSAIENCDITVDITNGDRSGTNIILDNVTFTQNDYYAHGTQIFGCVCKVVNCVQDCCPSKQTLDISSGTLQCITPRSLAYTNIQGPQLHHIIRVPDRLICNEEAVKISLDSSEFDFELKDHGFLEWEKTAYHYRNYCLSSINGSVVAVVCVVPDTGVDAMIYCIDSIQISSHTVAPFEGILVHEDHVGDNLNSDDNISHNIDSREVENTTRSNEEGMIISMPFLLATFLVYAILPERNVHQRALTLYVLTLCISYILLVTINLSSQLESPWCEITGYATLFFFMVSFFWMNVICFDIWYTFSGGRGFVGSKRTSERRRFMLYSVYAWGVPVFHVILVITLQNVLPSNSEHNPGIGVIKCFIADGWPNLWYFYGEAAILIIANIIFFLRTAFKIRQVKKETTMLKQNDSKRHAYEKDKQKFNLYLKLLFAMGVNWSMEVISALVNWQTNNKYTEIWYVTDSFNALYGVFIFFIFVFKKKIWKLLQKRYYNFIGKPHLAHTMTSSNTQTSHYSTNYSTADTNLTDRTNGARSEEIGMRRVT